REARGFALQERVQVVGSGEAARRAVRRACAGVGSVRYRTAVGSHRFAVLPVSVRRGSASFQQVQHDALVQVGRVHVLVTRIDRRVVVDLYYDDVPIAVHFEVDAVEPVANGARCGDAGAHHRLRGVLDGYAFHAAVTQVPVHHGLHLERV